jgi:hypothetical protein
MTGNQPNASWWNPTILQYTGSRPDVEVVTANTRIRQVNAPQALADVVTNNEFKFELRFYLPSQVGAANEDGTHQLSGSPFVTWTVENPDASQTITNRWRITESRDDTNRVFLYTYEASSNSWKLSWPGNLREDQASISANGGAQTREEVGLVRQPGGSVVVKNKRTYKTFSWGEGLIEERVGPDSNPQITTYHYYSSGVNNGSRVPRQQVVYPNGYWERYEYDGWGRRTKTVAQFGSTATNAAENVSRVTTYSYTPVYGSGDDGTLETNTVRTTIESLKGQEIGRGHTVIKPGERLDVVCPTPGASLGASDNLTNITKKFTTGPNLYRVQSVKQPDGTMSFFDYQFASGNSYQTNIVRTGEPNVGQTGIANGTETVTVLNTAGSPVSHAVRAIVNSTVGTLLSSESYTNFDQFGRPQRVIHLDGTFADTYYACCGVDNTTDRDGVFTQYYYDEMKRRVATTRLSITASNLMDAAGRIVKQVRKGSDGTSITLRQAAFDEADRLTAETNALGGVTLYVETFDGSGQLVRTSSYPDGGTRIELFFKDGSLQKVTGTAAFLVRYEYGAEVDGGYWRPYTKEIKLNADGTDSSEWTKTYTDGAGRAYKTVYAGASSPYRQSFYNNKGQLWKERDPDGVTTLYTNNAVGELAYTAVDSNRNDVIDFSGLDRITQTTNDVLASHSTNVRRTRTYVWDTGGSSTPTLLSTLEVTTQVKSDVNRAGYAGRK